MTLGAFIVAKFHINPETGNVGSCKAEQGGCPFGGDEMHFTSTAAARQAAERILSEKYKSKPAAIPKMSVLKDGTKKWRVKGKLHRDGDLPAVEYPDGTKEWWVQREMPP